VRRTALVSGLAFLLGIGLSGIGTATAEETPRAIHPPMPVPEMPVPPGLRAGVPPAAMSRPAAPAQDQSEHWGRRAHLRLTRERAPDDRPPSLDLGSGTGMLHMGSVAGILYAVELGF